MGKCFLLYSKEVYEDFNKPPTPPDYTTSFKAHYHKGFYFL